MIAIGELLIDFGVINQEILGKALDIQKQKGGLLGEVLVEMGCAKEEDIAQALSVQRGFPYLPLTNYEISPEVAKIIPLKVCRQHLLIPVDKIGKNMTLAMANPLNDKAIDEIKGISGCSVQAFVSTASDIKKAIEKYYK
jgi:type IV pilus assembly protein PilB